MMASAIPDCCNDRDMDADDVIARLGLAPHPEGGFYRETWAGEQGSAIYYLLRAGEWSRWHRVRDRVEIWHFYAGAAVELTTDVDAPGTATERQELGSDLVRGEQPQLVVPAGVWQRARSLGDWSLVGCTVTPPFTFEAFDLA
jgi:predicted cupin superfamily sugar epimerase